MRKIDVEIIEKLNADDSIQIESIEELRTQFENECAKDNPDYELIDEIAMLMAEKDGSADKINISDEIAELKRKTSIKPKRFYVPKWAAAVCASLILVLGLNAYSAYAWNMNIISAVIKFTKDGFSVDFGKQPEKIHLPTSEDDPYGFIAKLAEYDIEFETPHYIPEGFVLTEVSTNVNENYSNSVSFRYRNGKQKFIFSYDKYLKEVPDIIIPSDHYNISETEVNGYPAIISKEDNQYTITYQKEKTVFVLFTVDVPYDECDKIVASMK